MRRSSKVYILVFLALSTLVLGFLWTQRTHLDSSIAKIARQSWVPRPIQSFLIKMTRPNRPVAPIGTIFEERARSDKEIAELAKESFQRSIENLLTTETQFHILFGNDLYGPGASPFNFRLEEVLASRRAIKVLDTLGKLPQEERVQTCKEFFDQAFRALEDSAFANLQVKNGQYRTEPTHALSLALFATAETGRLDILAQQFKKLDAFEQRYEQRQIDIGIEHERARLGTGWRVPDDRFQLNVIRLAALRNSQSADLLKKIDAYCQSIRMKTDELTVVAWDARIRVSSSEESKGVKTYLFYNWGDSVGSMHGVTRDAKAREWVERPRSGSRMDLTKVGTTYFDYDWGSHSGDARRRDIVRKVREMAFGRQ